jgi:hypothetical protein
MELTKQQIDRIEGFLDRNNITYIDIRLEAYDHIITDIETKITTQNIDFETAFTLVTNSWKKCFSETSSFYFGIYYAAPKMVIEKAKKSFKIFFFIYISAYFLPLILIQYLKIPLFTGFIESIFPILQILGVLATGIFAFLMVKNFLIKEKSTYSFILRTQAAAISFGLIITLNYLFAKVNSSPNAIWVSFNFAFLISTYIYYIFYKKHIAIIKQYKIS